MAGKYVNKTISGTVTGVFFNEMDEDDYGNTMRPVVSVDRKYKVLLGGRKDEKLQVKVGDKWVPLLKGATVTINTKMAKGPKGENYYAKVSDITLDSKGPGNSSSSSGGSTKSYSSGSKSDSKDDYQYGIIAGHAVNNAVQLLVKETAKGAISDEAIVERAVRIAKLTGDVKDALMKPSPAAKSKKEKDPVEEFNSDDDFEEEEEAIADVEDEDTESPF